MFALTLSVEIKQQKISTESFSVCSRKPVTALAHKHNFPKYVYSLTLHNKFKICARSVSSLIIALKT